MSPESGGRPRRRAPGDQRRARRRPNRRGETEPTTGRRQRELESRQVLDGNDGRHRPRRERNFELPEAVVGELRSVADSKRSAMLERRLRAAIEAYERDRYRDALQSIKPVVEAAPESAAAREFYGLVLYRLGRWRQAERALRTVHEMTGSFDQFPVIADCERALGNPERVRALWGELRQAGVDKDVLVEGRLVMAGALADTGELEEAIALLEPAGRVKRRNADLALLREWYALADLYEEAGDLPRARELFQRVASQAPELLDAPERLRAIR